MLSSFELIHNLQNLKHSNSQKSAKIFDFNPTLFPGVEDILPIVEYSQENYSQKIITQEELLKQYGNYDKAYTAYQESYGIKCKRGWRYFLEAIEGLSPPISLEERVEKLEETVKFLLKILAENKGQ